MRSIFFLLLIAFFVSSCSDGQREKSLKEKEIALNQKEQELAQKENFLLEKENKLSEREKILDSSANKLISDSSVIDSTLPGAWNARMECTETTCPGSAVGDTKNEQWQIEYENDQVIARAISGNKQVRVYIGRYNGNTLRLSSDQNDSIPVTTKMIVRLQKTKDDEMEGQREIIRGEECRILYVLRLTRQ